MKKNELMKMANEQLNAVAAREVNLESFAPEFEKWGVRPNVFHYAAASEVYFERYFEGIGKGYKRHTTFSNDLAIAEWYTPSEGLRESVIDTIVRSIDSFANDVEYFGELILAVIIKSYEHASRGNYEWSHTYSDLYFVVRDLFFEWFDESHPKHEEAMSYYFDWVD